MQNKNKQRLIQWSLMILGVCFLAHLAWQAGTSAYAWLFDYEFASASTTTVTHLTASDEAQLAVLDNTPMTAAKPYIARASRYYQLPISLYLGIANAESSFKHFTGFNPWGIKPSGTLRSYESWEHSVNGFSQLVKYYYWNQGLQTAEQLELKYVGYQDPDWVAHVRAFHN